MGLGGMGCLPLLFVDAEAEPEDDVVALREDDVVALREDDVGAVVEGGGVCTLEVVEDAAVEDGGVYTLRVVEDNGVGAPSFFASESAPSPWPCVRGTG